MIWGRLYEAHRVVWSLLIVRETLTPCDVGSGTKQGDAAMVFALAVVVVLLVAPAGALLLLAASGLAFHKGEMPVDAAAIRSHLERAADAGFICFFGVMAFGSLVLLSSIRTRPLAPMRFVCALVLTFACFVLLSAARALFGLVLLPAGTLEVSAGTIGKWISDHTF